jgi:hypothetical protein
MQAEFEMKMQVIRTQGRAFRLFVNIPMPLAAALDIQAGERVRWQLLGRSELRLVRLEAPTPAKGLKK